MKNAKILMTITVPQLQVGNIAHAHGARFEIVSVVDCTEHHRAVELGEVIVSAKGKWLDGADMGAYFGPGIDWTFQGNANALATVEEDSYKFIEQADQYDYDKYN